MRRLKVVRSGIIWRDASSFISNDNSYKLSLSLGSLKRLELKLFTMMSWENSVIARAAKRNLAHLIDRNNNQYIKKKN